MTARGLLLVLLRRWYLLAIGAVLTLGAMYGVLHLTGVYWTKMTVVLLAPAEDFYPNKIEDPRYPLAPMAGVVVAEWNRENRPTLTASGDTTLFGEGKSDTVEVRMPNQGSQWRPLFLTPNIDVQVVGSDPERVEERAIEVGEELASILEQQQEDLGVDPRLWITSVSSPAEPTVYYITGSRARALGALGLTGALVTVVGIYWIDRGLSRRSRRRTGAAADSGPGDLEPVGVSSAAWTSW